MTQKSKEFQKHYAEIQGISNVVCKNCQNSMDEYEDNFVFCKLHRVSFTIISYCNHFKLY